MTHILKTRAGQSGILPQYYGTVNTNKGTGHIFDIIFDFDGNISASLNCLLQGAYFLKTHYYGLKNALIGLRETLFKFNPLYQFLTAAREIVLYGRAPSILVLVLLGVIALVTLGIGAVVFKKNQDKFIYYV